MLTDFINECHAALRYPSPGEVVRQIVLRELKAGDALKRELDRFNHEGEISQRMFGCFVHVHRNLTITKLKSVPYLRIAPHTHDMWAVIGCCLGTETNTLYRETALGLEEIERIQIDAPDAILLSADAIHSVHNPSAEEGCSIHIYGGDIASVNNSMWDPFTFKKSVLDVETMLEYSFALMDVKR